MNQLKKHWLLLDILITTINISLNMEAKVVGLGEGSEILDEFDSKFFALQKKCNRKSLR
jgi:hypothetical protein